MAINKIYYLIEDKRTNYLLMDVNGNDYRMTDAPFDAIKFDDENDAIKLLDEIDYEHFEVKPNLFQYE